MTDLPRGFLEFLENETPAAMVERLRKRGGYSSEELDRILNWTDAEFVAARNCYRPLSAGLRAENGVPDGYCSRCIDCGEAGHLCRYPGPAPFMGGWCDACYVAEFRSQRLIHIQDYRFRERMDAERAATA